MSPTGGERGGRRASASPKLVPPDLKRCQTEWREGSFMSLGPRGMIRCSAVPKWLATELAPDDSDGTIGSMSLCQKHREIFEKVSPGKATFEEIVLEPQVKKARKK